MSSTQASPLKRIKKLSISYVPSADVKADPRNPRQHSRKQVSQIAASMKRFGFNVPILVDPNRRILAGHGRLEAAMLLDLAEVPTICLDDLTPEQARAFMLADNKLAERSEWDQELVAQHFKELSELCLDFSLEDTGFEMGEIDLLIEGLEPAIEGEDPANQIPELDQEVQVTHSGDLWRLGKHRVFCGDARDEKVFEQLMAGATAAMVFLDPPYNIDIANNVSGKGLVKHKDFTMACGEMSEEDFIAFLQKAFSLLKRNLHDGSIVFVCMDWRHIGEVLRAGKSVFTEFKHLCIWAKDRASQGSFYRSQHELIFVFKNGKSAHINNIQLGQYGRYRTNLWQYPSAVSLARKNEEGNLLALHPTVKPVQMVADAIMDCSDRGDIVLDSFLGSGATLIAAERTGRICYGNEIDPHYVDVIVRRWQTFTG